MSIVKARDSWGSKLGVILAVAGSAVGLGNFLRFPVQAVKNGGGAFMIPYFVALLLLGLPLMWVEWALGRFGGGFGHGTAPGIFHSVSNKNRFLKYFGVVGIFGPIVILLFYTLIESWTLGFSYYYITGKVSSLTDQASLQSFLLNYQTSGAAYVFFLITFALNFLIIGFGVKKGIERFAKAAMPILILMAFILLARILTLGAPNEAHPDWNVFNGFGFIWNPDFTALAKPQVWLAAAGQIFFTLSVGIGVILTYASYLKRDDDIVLSGLTSTSINEFVEVILGASIIIPAAFAFFGPAGASDVANSGAFNLGFITLPMILNHFPLASAFGFLWFFLLFLAGLTSSISLLQPAIAFLEDEFNIGKKKAVATVGIALFTLVSLVFLYQSKGIIDELDFWGGNVCLLLFGFFEVILFGWVLGIDKAWDEIHNGAKLRIPYIYRFIIKYITPIFILVIFFSWILSDDGKAMLLMTSVSEANRPYILTARLLLLGLFATLCVLVHYAWKRRLAEGKNG